jgi:hypothetical protein
LTLAEILYRPILGKYGCSLEFFFGIRKGQVASKSIPVFEFQNGQVTCENKLVVTQFWPISF